MVDIWNLPYTSKDLENLYYFCIPPEPPPPPNTIVLRDWNEDILLGNIKNNSFDTLGLPVLLIASMQDCPVTVACIIMPFNKIPSYLNSFSDIYKKILEWRLQNGI